jgi:hypothetical protein
VFPSLDTLQLLLSIVLALLAALTLGTLVVPSLGRRVHRERWPLHALEPAVRRRIYAATCLRAAGLLGLAALWPLQDLPQYVCTAQPLARVLAWGGLLFAPLLSAMAHLIEQSVARTTAPKQPMTPEQRLAIAVVALLFWVLWNLPLPSAQRALAFKRVQMTSPTDGWAVRDAFWGGGGLYRYTGNEWSAVEGYPQVPAFADLSVVGPDVLWFSTTNGRLLRYDHGSWLLLDSPTRSLRALDAVSADEVWAIGEDRQLLRYRAGTWTSFANPTDAVLNSIDMLSPDEGWAVGHTMLHYQGGAWREVRSPARIPLQRVRMVSQNEGWAVGGERVPPSSVILQYEAGGWEVVSNPTTLQLTDIALGKGDEAWAIGGGMYRLPLDCPTAQSFGDRSAILHWENNRWQLAQAPLNDTLTGVAVSGGDAGWIVGQKSLLQYRDGRWQRVPLPAVP